MTYPRTLSLLIALAVLAGLAMQSGAGAAEGSHSIRLHTTHGSGVRARVTVTPQDGVTWLKVAVAGGDPDPSIAYLPYLHRGTCTAYDAEPAIPLALATADNDSLAMVDLPIETVLDGSYVVDLHVATGGIDSLLDPETSVVCGVLAVAAAKPAMTPVTTAPVTGIGPLTGGAMPLTMVAAIAAAGLMTMLAGMRLRRPAIYVHARIARRRARELLR